MGRDPFGFRQLLVEFAVSFLVIAICLHVAVILIAEVWPWLLGIGMTIVLLGLVWRVIRFRQDRW